MKVLLTGAAGFIGFHVAQQLLNRGHLVIGVDNINDYYETSLKYDRLAQLRSASFSFHKLDVANKRGLSRLFKEHRPERVIHLAAQAGVRYSLVNPYVYLRSNVSGFLNIVEECRKHQVQHLVYASSSSVYGANRKIPFSVADNVDHPISLYAATKKSNELIAHVYSYVYGLPSTGLRFFTVYGPWGRPDMAPFLFTRAILEGQPIQVFNYGKLKRDFTYVGDIAEGVIRVLDRSPDPAGSGAPYKLYNIGNNRPVDLLHFIEVLEQCLGLPAQKVFMPMQPGDVETTYADIDDLVRDVEFSPNTPIETGLQVFVDWYRDYYGVGRSACRPLSVASLGQHA
jgi:UDP-glucuronate 4-epimerase